ncbi:FAD-dependent monooxygenase [Fodinicola feengrottensis]|uniref:FAD-dependent monooxygenase n=1 Tax=Fodinicola feengrottensis TaxID=435914 RepID=UPI0013D2FD53|nr:FAD-dependent monooxygenase [Fodinicola feengrottensis]
MDADVVVVGAGPVGMTLAAELALAGVRAIVVEALPERSKLSRAGGVHPRTAEMLDQRGLLGPLLATGDYQEYDGAHLAGLTISYTSWNSREPGRFIPQTQVEAFLERQLAGRVPIRRGHRLVGVEQTADGVVATVSDGERESTLRALYLVGADGAHSSVRKLLGIDFPGRAGTDTAVVGDVRVTGPRAGDIYHEPPGQVVRSEDGRWAVRFPLGDGLQRLVIGGTGAQVSRTEPVTADEVRDGLAAVYGGDVELVDLPYVTRIADAARQVRGLPAGAGVPGW